jgi:hypothetical protein
MTENDTKLVFFYFTYNGPDQTVIDSNENLHNRDTVLNGMVLILLIKS